MIQFWELLGRTLLDAAGRTSLYAALPLNPATAMISGATASGTFVSFSPANYNSLDGWIDKNYSGVLLGGVPSLFARDELMLTIFSQRWRNNLDQLASYLSTDPDATTLSATHEPSGVYAMLGALSFDPILRQEVSVMTPIPTKGSRMLFNLVTSSTTRKVLSAISGRAAYDASASVFASVSANPSGAARSVSMSNGWEQGCGCLVHEYPLHEHAIG